jgi:hypothetical protein
VEVCAEEIRTAACSSVYPRSPGCMGKSPEQCDVCFFCVHSRTDMKRNKPKIVGWRSGVRACGSDFVLESMSVERAWNTQVESGELIGLFLSNPACVAT